MGQKRKKHSAEFKARVVRAALREDKSMSELSSEYGIHPTQIAKWKKHALDILPDVFNMRASPKEQEFEQERDNLHRKIGQMQIEADWLKKKCRQLGLDC